MHGLDLLTHDVQIDPYPTYEEIRQNAPFAWNDEFNAWLTVDHALSSQILKSKTFSADRVSLGRHRYAEKYQPVFDLLSHIMIQTDEPEHKLLRDLTHDAFTRTAVTDYRADILERCERLMKPGLSSGSFEFMQQFAIPLPLLVISKIVGMPEEDLHRIKDWCDAYSTIALKFYTHIDEDDMEISARKVLEFAEYLEAKVRQAEETPGPDLISSLALAAKDQNLLTMQQVVATCMILLNAGNETTTCVLGNGLRMLLENPDQLAILQSDPSLIPSAVEEFLRIECPVLLVARVALEDQQVGSHLVRQGQMVLMLLGAANRDPEAFDNPDQLDLTRTHNHHLSFGTGTHLCAGIQLARFEAKVAFEYLLPLLDRFELVDPDWEFADNVNLRALKRLRLRVAPE